MYKVITNQDNNVYVTPENEMLSFDAVTVKELENVVSDLESVIDTKYDKTSAEQEHYALSEKIDAEESRAVAKETDLSNTIQDEITTRTQENTEITKDISSIINKIPNQASSTNQLADKNFVNSTINSSAATFKGNFATKAALDAVQWQTTDSSLNTYVANNDYAYVELDETHNNEAWRYIYVKNNTTSEWQAQFKVNDSPFTSEQLAAINSGATSELIDSISSKLDQEDIVDLTGNSSTKAISQRAATLAVQNVQEEFNNYLPLSGGVVTGDLYTNKGITVKSGVGVRLNSKDNTQFMLYGDGASQAVYTQVKKSDGSYGYGKLMDTDTKVYSQNKEVAVKDDLSSYLPKTGDTMEGDINLSTSRGFTGTTTSGNRYDVFRVDSANRKMIVGGTYPALELKGLNERPTYNGSDVALLSDVQTSDITIDTELSTTSTNAVQNKVIAEAFENNKLYMHSFTISNQNAGPGDYNIQVTGTLITRTSESFTLETLASYLNSKINGLSKVICYGQVGKIGTNWFIEEYKLAAYVDSNNSTSLSIGLYNVYDENSEEPGIIRNSAIIVSSDKAKVKDYVYEI